MQVQARSEGGIVIAAYQFAGDTYTAPEESAFASEATATASTSYNLYPTSALKDLTKWFHAKSTSVNSHTGVAGTYEELTLVNGKTGTSQYYLMNKFDIKSLEGTTNLYVSTITVSNSTNSAALNRSLRIAIKNTGTNTVYIFAPLYTTETDVTTLAYCSAVNATSHIGTVTNYASGEITCGNPATYKQVATGLGTTAVAFEIYIYYEGEDVNCKSINATNIDTLTIDVAFTTNSSAS